MNVVDSSGWLEYFGDGKNAGFFAAAIVDAKRLIVPSICVFEVFKRLLQQKGEDCALEAVTAMQQGTLVPLDSTLATYAAKISCVFKLPMADSIVWATAKNFDAMLWTQDVDFKNIPGVKYIAKLS